MNALMDELLRELVHKKIIKNQTDFADKIGVGKSYLSKMVNGSLPVTEKMATKIATEFPEISKDWGITYLTNPRG